MIHILHFLNMVLNVFTFPAKNLTEAKAKNDELNCLGGDVNFIQDETMAMAMVNNFRKRGATIIEHQMAIAA